MMSFTSSRLSIRSHRATFFHVLSTVLAIALAVLPVAKAEQNLTETQVAIVVQRLADITSHSWEYGTQEQTLIELNTPSFNVLNGTPVPPPKQAPDSLSDVLRIITGIIQQRNTKLASGNHTGPQPLFGEGSAADPASNGVAALIADWTGHSTNDLDFGQAAEDQMAYLWSSAVPKTDDGAISHRVEQAQLWNDFVYMVPPFLAYYGVLKDNQSMIEESYNQIHLYRNYLRDPLMGGLWKHVLLGDWSDTGYWSTGNGWAAAGMLRVMGTIMYSKYADEMKGEIYDLSNWVDEIHDAMYPYMRDDGMFHNYATNTSTFVDAASAALLAATVYRQALLTGSCKHIPDAEYVRRALWAPTSGVGNDFTDSNSMADMQHFTEDGYLMPVVNPNNFALEGTTSPEGQAFVVQMYRAWSDWVANGAVGAKGGDDGISIKIGSRGLAAHSHKRKRAIRF